MSPQAVLLPLLVQVALTFGLGFWMASRRVRAIRSGAVHPRDIALREPNWPKPLMQLQNALANQLELPVLAVRLDPLALDAERDPVRGLVLGADARVADRASGAGFAHGTSARRRERRRAGRDETSVSSQKAA